MSDRLKLSDAKGEAEVARVAEAQELMADHKRIKELEKNIAALEAELAKPKRNVPATATPQRNKIGARKQASFMAISTAPSINKTPVGPSMVPIPYPMVQDLTNSTSTAKTVNFNGSPVYLLDCSSQPSCKGDAPGTGKGVRSGTVSGEVKPIQGTKTVRIEGKRIVREGDACTMNGGNNPGVFVVTPTSSTALAAEPGKLKSSPNPSSNAGSPGSADVRTAHLGLFEKTPKEKLAALIQTDTLDGSSSMRRNAHQVNTTQLGEKLVPLDLAAATKNLHSKNNLEIAILGIFGAPGSTARLLGQSEDQVAAANHVGLAAMGVATAGFGLPGSKPVSIGLRSSSRSVPPQRIGARDGVKVLGAGGSSTTPSKTLETLKVEAEILALHKFGGTNPGPGERAITKQQYKSLISKYRSEGDRLQADLDTAISQQQFVYRATTMRTIEIYRASGKISGKSGAVFMSTEYVGVSQKVLMDRGQVFDHWGTPQALLKIPTSALTNASVPRPFGNKADVGWEPLTEAYPAAGKGGMNQFLGETKTSDDSWVIVLKPGS